MLPFLVSVTLTGLVRISKMRYRWKDLSLKLLLFINLYLVTRGPTIFPGKSGRLKERCSFDIHHLKGFQETIYFSRKKTITICTYLERTDQQHLRLQLILSELKFKFLGDKKGPTKGFYLEVWKIYSVFLHTAKTREV